MRLGAFLTFAALIVYSYVVYPTVLCILAALFGRRGGADETYTPTVSVLIPAFNEEDVIARKIENTLELDYPRDKLEVIVASESSDGTDAITRRYEKQGVRLLSSTVRRGKVANLNRAIPESRGEILLLTDATAMLRPNAMRKMVRHFADGRIGSVSGRLIYAKHSGTAAAVAEGIYWEMEQILKWASSRLFSLPGATGSLFAVRRRCYRLLSADRGDDFEIAICCILDGHGAIQDPEAISVEEATGSLLHVYRRKVRISNWMFRSALILLAEAIRRGRWLLALQLSHRINRWAVPAWLIGLLASTLCLLDREPLFQVIAAAQVGLYTIALSFFIIDRIVRPLKGWLGMPSYFLVVNAASLVGIITGLLGYKVTWYKTR